MAFSDVVALAVASKGETTVGVLQTMFPGQTRRQIQKALQNAQYRGLVRTVERGRGGGRGSVIKEGVWAKAVAQDAPVLPKDARPPSCVWELASLKPRGKWPPRFDGGRAYTLYDEEEA